MLQKLFFSGLLEFLRNVMEIGLKLYEINDSKT